MPFAEAARKNSSQVHTYSSALTCSGEDLASGVSKAHALLAVFRCHCPPNILAGCPFAAVSKYYHKTERLLQDFVVAVLQEGE